MENNTDIIKDVKELSSWKIFFVQLVSFVFSFVMIVPHMMDSDGDNHVNTIVNVFSIWFTILSFFGFTRAIKSFIREGSKYSIGNIVLILSSAVLLLPLIVFIYDMVTRGHFIW